MTYVRLKFFFKLIRYGNLLLLFLTQFFVKICIIDKGMPWMLGMKDLRFMVLNFSTVLIAAAGYIINDYYDIKIDLVNKPRKLIVGKSVSRRKALIWHLSLTVIGVAAGFYNGYLIGGIHLFSAFMLWWYSNKLKRLPLTGNVVVAFLSGLSIYIIAICYRNSYDIILCYALFAFYISLIREIIKDIEDMKGDAAFGCATLPLVWGIRKTKRFIVATITLFMLTILFLLPQFPALAIIYLSLLVLAPLCLVLIKLHKADTQKDFSQLSLYCKFLMCSGLGSILFLH